MYSEKGSNLQLNIFQSSFDTFSIQMLNERPMCNSKKKKMEQHEKNYTDVPRAK